MKLRLAKYAGFCSGVKRALNMVLKEAAEGKKVSTLGPLVHNEEVSKRLAREGVEIAETPGDKVGSVLVIRTHGVTPLIMEQALALNNTAVVDATCPRVRRVQRLAAELARQGIQLIIYGDPQHPEVKGVVGWAGEKVQVISSSRELAEISLQEPAALLTQTTADRVDFAKTKEAFLTRIPAGQVFETLCPETGLREEEARRLAREVDAMIVVGSSTSANTTALVDVCRASKPTCRVAHAGELDVNFFRGYNFVGLTAGASAPHWTIKEVVERMENEGFVVENAEEKFAFDGEIKAVQAGEQVAGKVVRATLEEVFLDIGYKGEALLPLSEVFLDEGVTLPDRFTPGDEIEVTVLSVDEQDDKVIVSHKRLSKENRWTELEQAHQDGTILEGKVKQVVPAGMVIDLGTGIEGFMPGSLVDTRFIPDFKQFMGETVQFKVLEFNREKDKVILSRKKIIEEANSLKKEETLKALTPGSVITGQVRRLTDFGAFVDVGGIDGLVHISELSWERVGHPKDALKVGEEIEVKVLEVIPEKERISLSLRQVQPDPWSKAMQDLSNGQILTGKVTRLAPFGAFVELKPGVEGLVHVSQIADYHVKQPSEVLTEGQEVEVKILELKPDSKRISLSIKDAGGVIHHPQVELNKSGDDGNVTLGDVFGDLFQKGKDASDGSEGE